MIGELTTKTTHITILIGTFDRLHVGHKHLIRKSYEYAVNFGSELHIFINKTGNKDYQSGSIIDQLKPDKELKKLEWLIESEEKRKKQIEEYCDQSKILAKICLIDKSEKEDLLVQIKDRIYGLSIISTRERLDFWSKLRDISHNKFEIEIVEDYFHDGVKPSSTLVRQGVLNDRGERLMSEEVEKYCLYFDEIFMCTPYYNSDLETIYSYLKNRNNILVSGCRTGNIVEIFHRYQKNPRFDLVEQNLLFLSIAERKFKGIKDICFFSSDISQYIDEGKYDGICSILNIHFVKDRRLYLENIFKSLQKDGVFVLSGVIEEDTQYFVDRYSEYLISVGKEYLVKTLSDCALKHIKKSAVIDYTFHDMIEMLEQIGFTVIDILSDATHFGKGYIVVCRK